MALLIAGCGSGGDAAEDAATEAGTDAEVSDGGEADGGGGDAGEPLGPRCAEACETDADCTQEGEDNGFDCDADGTCRVLECDPDRCTANSSGWTTPCMTADDCFRADHVCIELGGEGRCATESDSGACGENYLPIERELLSDGSPVEVCGRPSRCEGRVCLTPCTVNGCIDGYECNAETDRCECMNDAACPPGRGCGDGGRCSLCRTNSGCPPDWDCADDGRCVCTPGACEGRGSCNLETGRCECDSDTQCTEDRSFDGTDVVCEGL